MEPSKIVSVIYHGFVSPFPGEGHDFRTQMSAGIKPRKNEVNMFQIDLRIFVLGGSTTT